MAIVRVVLLIVYLISMYMLNRYLRDHYPTFSKTFVPGWMRPWIALFWIWGPTIWLFPGILWVGLLNLSLFHVLVLSFTLPLTVFVIFMLFVGMFPISSPAHVSDRQSSLFSVGLLVMVTGLALILALIDPDLSIIRFLLFIATVITPPLLSMIALAWWTPEVIPLGHNERTPIRRALALLFGYFSTVPRPSWVVEEVQVHQRIRGNAATGTGPGWLLTEPENVVVLKAGAKITRVAGPGIVLTGRGEAPYRVIDLRNQIRSTRVNAITRDGIEVQMPISSLFRVDRGHKKVQLKKPWPYHNQRDVLHVAFSEEVDPTGKSPLEPNIAQSWANLPINIAAHKLEQAISFYTLDQLYAGITDPRMAGLKGEPQAELLAAHRKVEAALGLSRDETLTDALTRTAIGKLVRCAVRQELEPRGFEVLGGGVGNRIVPLNRQVTEQRVEVWKSRFVAKLMDWYADLQRERYRALGRIQRDARAEMVDAMINQVSEQLERVADDETKRNVIAYHIMDSLMRIAQSPEIQEMLPDSAMPTLVQLYKQIGGTEGSET